MRNHRSLQMFECVVCLTEYACTQRVSCTTHEHVDSGDGMTHGFCRDCVRGHAGAATTSAPIAEGGRGLQCMVGECKNVIELSQS
jgi:hypothetical protein